MPVQLQVSVTKTGHIFSPAAKGDVEKAVKQVIRETSDAGMERLAQVLRKSPAGVYLADGGSTGNYRRNVSTHLVDAMNMLITDGGVVYGPWLEGVGSRNATTRFKGYQSFRRTAQYLQTKVEAIANSVIARFVARMNS